eukprot:SM000076S21816  [mRNA]  locus=s76:332341:333841:- [translate_table: standard]
MEDIFKEYVPELEEAEKGGEHTEALERLLELHALGDRLLGFRMRYAAGVTELSGLSGDSVARQQQVMSEERAEAGTFEGQADWLLGQLACRLSQTRDEGTSCSALLTHPSFRLSCPA